MEKPLETLKTLKIPVSTHTKLKALARMKNVKLYDMVEELANSYIDLVLSAEQKAVYEFIINQEK